MSIITAKGQTVEKAVQEALTQLEVLRDQVDVKIVDEGKRGFLGFLGSRPAIVEVVLKKDPIQEAEQYLQSVVQEMGVDVMITKEVKGREIKFTLSGNDVGVLIGKRGHTLNSLQYLTKLVANRSTKQYIGVTIDAENYRNKRKDTLESLSYRLAKQVMATKKNIVLEPMPSFERKIIHQALSNHPNVITTSEGKEPHRHVVISSK
ncbi:RNA-binding cell elongation regulator Jag/EloR [Bacillus sp. DX1.1]|uniref:RNA-binding cell elongation regulator Jag/EloR n=1 Tax=unclassified Bacillus (in: firmicutes) TaxID=185979 RepID=UPI0025709656|nr:MULTISPECIES: RNA-binding cell elongation regulator Jag/EloR [unclassified Bacillus (in: firmicutes)]MDM5157593.1 RNA-binding cell elongation regulator Jag/EloR [Bacillus sp. DX1.1]WJE81807.1 RNA-binding cell elongation regulator Jag/EloR [Bacillus sp. DX3.1]